MVIRIMIVVAIIFLTGAPSLAAGSENKPFAYVSGKRFLEWPSSSRIDYIAGVIDGLSFLTETAGVQRGLSACMKENTIDISNPITWQLITRDAVVEAAKKGDADSISVPQQLFDKMKIVCRDHYPDQ